MSRRTWLAVSMAAGIVSVLIAVSGGTVASVGGVRISARSWEVPAALAAVAAGVWGWAAWRAQAVHADLTAVDARIDTHGRPLALGVALLTTVTALWFGTYSAAGADASGYLSQAVMWSEGAWRVADPLVTRPDWPLGPDDTVPLGWRPALEHGWQVPTYAPGLPLLMAVPHAVAGIWGAMALVALAGGLAVMAGGALADRLGGGRAALVATILIATSPSFLYQAVQVMSDVPVTAAWVAAWWLVVCRRPAAAGIATAIAVLIRPNLAPLAAVPWVLVIADDHSRVASALRFAAPVAFAGGVLAWLQDTWYGSPLRSGYGSVDELFALTNVLPNARLYAGWAWDAETAGILALAVCGSAWLLARLVRKEPDAHVAVEKNCAPLPRDCPPILVGALLLFAFGVVLAYLVYAVFEVWSYLRFLLPALALLAVLAGAAATRGLAVVAPAWRAVLLLPLVVLIGAANLHAARTLGVFRVAEVQARAREVGDALAHTLLPRAVLLAGEQSGSMRYSTGRPIVRWDSLDAVRLERALAALAASDHEVWWVLDQFEEPLVRARFPGVAAAMLDWPPRVEGGPVMRTRAWRLRDRP